MSLGLIELLFSGCLLGFLIWELRRTKKAIKKDKAELPPK